MEGVCCWGMLVLFGPPSGKKGLAVIMQIASEHSGKLRVKGGGGVEIAYLATVGSHKFNAHVAPLVSIKVHVCYSRPHCLNACHVVIYLESMSPMIIFRPSQTSSGFLLSYHWIMPVCFCLCVCLSFRFR